MAVRPVYIPSKKKLGIITKDIDFEWYPGFSKQQKQKSYNSLHNKFREETKIENILEVSSASEEELGRKLSAFNLSLLTKKNVKITVETAFQGSKVFERGGPYTDLYGEDSSAAKKDDRLKSSGDLIGFNFFREDYPLEPQTFFYDWLYLNTLHSNKEYREAVLKYDAFTDIEFNPKKSINNQANSVAMYVSLSFNNLIEEALQDRDSFLKVLDNVYKSKNRVFIQQNLI